MKVAFYQSLTDTRASMADVSWSDLADTLATISETDCAPCPGHDCPAKKDGGWSPVDLHTPKRLNANVTAVTLAVFDLDNLTDAQLLDAASKIEGYEYVCHSTHSHRPGKNCVRVIIPLSRPVPAAQWLETWRAAVALLGLPVDTSCKDESRFYYLPTICRGLASISERGSGRPLDVDALGIATPVIPSRAAAGVPDFANPPPVIATTLPNSGEPIDLESLRQALRHTLKNYRSKESQSAIERAAVLERVLTGAPLAQSGERDKTMHRAASILATALPTNTPVEAALEILRPSIAAMPIPEGLDHWLGEARDSYARAMVRRIENDTKRDLDNKAILDRVLASLPGAKLRPLDGGNNGAADTDPGIRNVGVLGPDSGNAVSDSDSGVPPGPVGPEGWEGWLIRNEQGDGLKNCGANVATILVYSQETAPGGKPSLRFNEVTKDIEVSGGLFEGQPSQTLDVAVSNWLTTCYKIHVKPHDVEKQIAYVARAHPYDPIREYLTGLEWDGEPRCDEWLETFAGAVTVGADGQDITSHIRRIGAMWMIAAVARGLRPGCKADNVLILEGIQDLKKSSAFAVLGGKWFSDSKISIGDKDSMMLAGASWIVELAELAAMRRGETEQQKAFFTSATDRFRVPYGKSIETFPRRCLFVGTCNPGDTGYLTDPTGNRRYWPVRCERIDLEGLKAARDQLWAEATARFNAGEKWYFENRDHAHEAEQIAAERFVDSALYSRIPSWWYSLVPSSRPGFLRTSEVAERIGIPADRLTRNTEIEIANVLARMGCRRERRLIDGIRQWGFVPTAAMLATGQSRGPGPANATVLTLIAESKGK